MALKVNLKEAKDLQGQYRDWAYNALDVTGTREVWDALYPRLDDQTERTYAFERACQNPAIAMMRRGVRVDLIQRAEAIKRQRSSLRESTKAVNETESVKAVWDGKEKETGICPKNDGKRHKWQRGVEDTPERKCEVCGCSRFKPVAFNPGSPPQTNRLFYSLLDVPALRNKSGAVSTDNDTLLRIKHKRPDLTDVVEAILDVRNAKKQLGFLNGKLTPDDRYPSSFNVGTAWTGRWSSSKNPFGLGGNLQNVAERHRMMFIPDAGYEMAYCDLKTAESQVVAYLADDEEYIEAHLSGDVHTYVTRLLWPELPWTGDLLEDKKIAKSMNPEWDQAPGHDYRFQAKRIQHGSNYGLSPRGVALIAKIPEKAAREMQSAYFQEFPFIREYQSGVGKLIKEHEPLINPLGRRCRLFGRPDDPHTLKQGLAFLPQSTVADIINIGMWRVWKELDPETVQLLAQVHDAILCQWKPEDRQIAVDRIRDLMTIDVPINGRTCTIPIEIAVGKNWGHRSPENPRGIEEI